MNLVREGVCALAKHWREDSRPKLEVRHSTASDPHEFKLWLRSAERLIGRKLKGFARNLNLEVETDLVKWRTGVGEEVFNDPQQAVDRNSKAKLFRELANQSVVCGLPGFDAPAGERPEGVSIEPVQEYAWPARRDSSAA